MDKGCTIVYLSHDTISISGQGRELYLALYCGCDWIQACIYIIRMSSPHFTSQQIIHPYAEFKLGTTKTHNLQPGSLCGAGLPVWCPIAGNILLWWRWNGWIRSCFRDRRGSNIPIPPEKQLVDRNHWPTIDSIFKEVNNKIIKWWVMEAHMLLFPVLCRVQGEDELRQKASETNSDQHQDNLPALQYMRLIGGWHGHSNKDLLRHHDT